MSVIGIVVKFSEGFLHGHLEIGFLESDIQVIISGVVKILTRGIHHITHLPELGLDFILAKLSVSGVRATYVVRLGSIKAEITIGEINSFILRGLQSNLILCQLIDIIILFVFKDLVALFLKGHPIAL